MKSIGYVMASRLLIEGKKNVGFMYREKGIGQDSGWRFFAGEEDQDYVDNPDNIGIYDVQTVIDIDKSVVPYLESAEGCAYERVEGTNRFRMLDDYQFGSDLGEEQ